MKRICFFVCYLFVYGSTLSQTVQQGPYTITKLAEGVFDIEDANDDYPAGVLLDENGEVKGLNNCSNMYLIVGAEKAFLIDLSNAITWDSTATESLREIIYARIGSRELYITATHWHQDHLGMLPAFAGDQNSHFWVSASEFKTLGIFPKGQTTYFNGNESMDLGGGFIIDTYEMPGHTPHSTLFFLRGKNIVFTGDAMGSGSGVWLFDEAGFYTYSESIDRLIAYLEDEQNNIDAKKLLIRGAHNWQAGDLGKLTIQYAYDMQTLIQKMGLGETEIIPVTYQFPFLNANFKYGTATITWNTEAAERYSATFKTE